MSDGRGPGGRGSYGLGVDLGTTFVAAATAHAARVDMFTLGDRTVVAPAVVFARDDGTVVTGEAANRRAVSNPDRVGREFKRRLGDPTPVMLGGSPHAVTALLAALLDDVFARVTATEGVPPDRVVLTHPANWGPYRRELFEEVPHLAGLPHVQMVTEPEAAAAHYAAARQLADGDTVAVYDLGGGTFDATVLRKRGTGIDILGTPEGIERLGGVDFDDAILSHINYTSGGALSELDMSNPQTAIALARMRQDCVAAKEALSVDTEATIPVFLPNRHFDVQLTRAEFEDMIRAQVESTIGALTRTLRSAHVEPDDLSAVLLVGGSSRIPLVARMITESLGRPTVVDTHPKYAVALGAATLAAELAPEPVRHREPAPPVSPAVGEAAPGTATAAVGALTAAGATTGRTAGGDPRNGAGAPPDHAPPAYTDLFTPAPPYAPAADDAGGWAPGPTRWDTSDGTDTTTTAVDYGGDDRPTDHYPIDAYRTGGNSGGHSGGHLTAPPGAYPGDPAYPGNGGPPPAPGKPRRLGPVVLAVAVTLLVAVGALVYLFSRPSDDPGATAAASSATVPAPAPLPPPAQRPADKPLTVAPSLPIPSVAGQVDVGSTPGYVAIAPNGKFAYVANRGAGVVTVLDTAIDKVVATIPITDGPPQYLAFAPDGSRLYVSVFNDQQRSINRVAVLDTRSNTVLTTIPVGTRPYALAVKPDGSEIYVPNHDSGTVSVIDTRSNALVTDIRVKANPHWVEFSEDGTKAYTANHESNLVSVIDTATRTVLAEVPVQQSPHSVAVHPDKPLVANVNYDSDSLTVIDATTNKVVATVPVGTHPQDVTWAPDGRHLYVTNVDSDDMTVIAADGYKVTATIPTGQAATSVAVLPDGTKGYVSNLNSGTLTILDLAS